jgi:hypothetical protein
MWDGIVDNEVNNHPWGELGEKFAQSGHPDQGLHLFKNFSCWGQRGLYI